MHRMDASKNEKKPDKNNGFCERGKIKIYFSEVLDDLTATCYNFNLRGHILRILPCISGGIPVITELASQEKVIGVKQSRKAIREGRACQVYLACDADPAITDPVADGCSRAGIPVETEYTMAQLGKACRITVGASVVAVLAE